MMKGFLRTGGTLTLMALIWLGLSPKGWSQTIHCPDDIYLKCDDPIPDDPDPGDFLGSNPGSCQPFDDWKNHEACCDNQALDAMDGCVVNLDECFQVALICYSADETGFTYHFKVFNNCTKDMSSITFSLPERHRGTFPNDLVKFQNSCGTEYKVETPSSGPGRGVIKFTGKVETGKSACFSYKVFTNDVQEEIVIRPKLSNYQPELIIEPTECKNDDDRPEIKEVVKLGEEEKGSLCEGRKIIRKYKIVFKGEREPAFCSQEIHIAPDKKAPTGICPEGLHDLNSIADVPKPEEFLKKVKKAYSDDCGAVHVEFKGSQTMENDCRGFRVKQVYVVYDDCRNKTICEVIHSGKGSGSGDITGTCPRGKSDLQCKDELPSADQLVKYIKENFKGADGGAVYVKIVQNKVTGDHCDFGAWYTFEIKDNCGNVEYCQVEFTGGDKIPPRGICPEGKHGLTRPEEAPSVDEAIRKVKEAYTDNCGNVDVEFKGQMVKAENCGDFKVIQRFLVKDKCGNSTWCEITHTGSGGGGHITGTCPPDKSGLQCKDDLPSAGEVANYIKENFKGADGGAVLVRIIQNKVTGDDCDFGAWYKFEIQDKCGNVKYCQVEYTGGDKTPPTGVCPEGAHGLKKPQYAPSVEEATQKVKEAYTDNCGGPVYVEFKGQSVEDGDCGSFRVIQKFLVKDQCGNSTWCKIIHTGEGNGGGSITGKCPPNKSGLQCKDDLPSAEMVARYIKENAQGADGGPVVVRILQDKVTGDNCHFGAWYKFEVKDRCGNVEYCQVEYTGGDTTPPSGHCPEGKHDLTKPQNAPSPEEAIRKVKEAYSDNCGGPIYVEFKGQTVEGEDCGEFRVIQKFLVKDKCGNSTWCKITHTGKSGGGEITGKCPAGSKDLQCISEVPDPDPEWVASHYKGADGGEVMVSYEEAYTAGDECSGFMIIHKYVVKDNCGNRVLCWVKHIGKDTKAPTGECPKGDDDLEDISQVPAPAEVAAVIKNRYTDNCGGPVTVTYVGKDLDKGKNDCGDFVVTQKFKVADECGNFTWCKVTFKGSQGEPGKMKCPESVDGLTCIDQVPPVEEVIEQIMAMNNGEVNVEIDQIKKQGDECSGFRISYQFKVTDRCNHRYICWVAFKGKDDQAPSFVEMPEDKTIACDEEIVFDKPQATDNCGDAVVKKLGDDLRIDGDCEESYSLVRTWVAIDECDNVSEPITQTITIGGDCCQRNVCAYTPVYWGQNPGSDDDQPSVDGNHSGPTVKGVLEANGGTITIGSYVIDATCIDVLLPGMPLATIDELAASCPDGLQSSSLIRHTIALSLNVLNDPNLCDVKLSKLECPIDLEFYHFDQDATVCDLLARANESIAEEWFDCELADALASVNECFSCLVCVPEEDHPDDADLVDHREEITVPRNDSPVQVLLPGSLDLEVFPNPSRGLVNLKFAGFEEDRVRIYVQTLQGELVHQTVVDEGSTATLSLDLASMRLPSGTYVVTATTGEQTQSRKLIVSYQE